MSVYIPGMEMPKDECVGIFVYPDGRVHVWRSMSLVGQEYKAIPVPEHGRLIDADTAEVITYTDEKGDFADGILFAAEWIANQPTIIPADTIFTKKEIYEYRNN